VLLPVILVLAIGAMWAAGRSGDSTSGLPAERLARIVESTDEANRLVHYERRTIPGLREAVSELREAHRLAAVPGTEGRVARWLLATRLGEAYLASGFLSSDPADYLASCDWYLEANRIELSLDELESLPPEWPLLRQEQNVSLHLPLAGIAAARHGIGTVQQSVSNTRVAVDHAERARRRIVDRPGETFSPWSGRRARQNHAAVLLNDLGRYTMDLGAALRDPDLVARAMDWFARVDSIGILAERDRWSLASHLANRGEAFLRRHALVGTTADLDSALTLLDRAWLVAGSAPTGTLAQRVAILRVDARIRSGGALDDLAGVLDSILAKGPAELRVVEWSRLLRARVSLLQELAIRRRDVQLLVQAGRWLTDALAVVPAEGLPIERGELLLARARNTFLGERLGQPLERGDPTDDLASARMLIPAIERPEFAIRLESMAPDASDAGRPDPVFVD